MKDFLVRFFLCVFIISFLLQVAAQTSLAAQFNYASLRLNRLAANSPVSGFVCATPSAAGAGTEDSITVTFPTSFSISSNPSNWTVSTSGLPAGSTAWPGIGTATGVSGKAVTFPSNDLNNGSARYCFAYTGASSTTGSSTGSQEGSLTTKNSSNTTIDSSVVAVSIGNDQVTLNATVPASPTSFSADIVQTSPASPNVNQNEVITYEITYGSELSYESDFTIQASWSQGTIAGSGSPSVDIADYVLGSAIDAYGGATPIIDTVNRTISWDVEGFPPNTTQTVTFQLQTNASYTGSENVTFTVSGKIIGPGTETVPTTVTNTYTYNGPASPTVTPTPGSGGGGGSGATSTPGPTSSITPTPTGTPQTIRLEDVEMTQIDSTSADITVQLSAAANIQIRYGTSPRNLTQRVTSARASANQTIQLSDLEPNTVYYFQVVIPNQNTSNELFTFKTAKNTAAAVINDNSIIIVSNNVILFDQFIAKTDKNSVVVLPGGNIFYVKFGFKDSQKIKTIQLFIQPKSQVLGVSTFLFPQAQAAGINTTMVKVKGSEYLGKLRIPEEPGMYELYARVLDEDGHLLNEQVVLLKSSPPMKIMNSNGKPIERAQVLLEYFDPSQKRFVVVSSQGLAVANPSYSDYKGIVPLTLPQAQYRAKISAFGYKDKTVIWTIGPDKGQDYPQVKLEKAPFSPLGFADYFGESAVTITQASLGPLYIFLHSEQFFIFLATVTVIVFVGLIVASVLSLSILRLIPGFLRRSVVQLSGQVVGLNKSPIRQATVHFYDSDDKLLKTLSTNNQGRFSIQMEGIDRIEVVKEGYIEAKKAVGGGQKDLIIELETDESTLEQVTHSLSRTLISWLKILLQIGLYGIVLAEVLMLLVFPILQVVPVLILAVLNVVVWKKIK